MHKTRCTRTTRKNLATAILLASLLLLPLPLGAQGTGKPPASLPNASLAPPASTGPILVASTSWVGAIAKAAGASNVIVLAPLDLRHPPEYDFKPADVIAAAKADLILWAGYEGFVKNLRMAAGIPEDRVVKVATNNAPPQLRASVRSLAKRLGTTESIAAWERELDELEKQMLAGAKRARTASTKAAVQFHQQAFARYLGFDVAAVFGPGELTMGDVQKIEALGPDLIIDNWHSAQGEPLRGGGRRYVQLVNFPGPFGNKAILDVVRYNAAQLGLLPPERP